MREWRMSGSVGAPGEKSPGATRQAAPAGNPPVPAVPRRSGAVTAGNLRYVVMVSWFAERRHELRQRSNRRAVRFDHRRVGTLGSPFARSISLSAWR
jgi:hypothetical protein